jgi:hypothetical protein
MFDQRSKRDLGMAKAEHSPEHRIGDAAALAEDISSRRRDILKAAATAAPLVATLPSGEALANASALQCVINQKEGKEGFPDGRVASPPNDTYKRITGFIERWRIPNPSDPSVTILVFVYRVTDPLGQEVTVYGDNTDQGIPTLPAEGRWFDTTIDDGRRLIRRGGAQFLYVYTADRDGNAVTNNSIPGDCTIDSSLGRWPTANSDGSAVPAGPDSPEHCFYPMAIQVQVPTNAPGNVALTLSCLASFT